MSEDVTLAAGTLVQHLYNGEWRRVPRLTTTGETGSMSEAKEKTTIEDKIKRYGSGLRDGGDKTVKGQRIPKQVLGDQYYQEFVDQQAFLDRCKNEEEMELRITFPDLERAQSTFKPLGYMGDDVSAEDWRAFTIDGKQNSFVSWTDAADVSTITVDGEATMTVGDNTQLEVINTPLDGYYSATEDTFETSDASVVTVTKWGYVTAVGAGTATITVNREVSNGVKVTGTLEVTVS